MDPKKIDRINELAKKKKTEGLTPEEKVEQAKLREEYIEGYRRTVRHHRGLQHHLHQKLQMWHLRHRDLQQELQYFHRLDVDQSY